MRGAGDERLCAKKPCFTIKKISIPRHRHRKVLNICGGGGGGGEGGEGKVQNIGGGATFRWL